MQLEHFYRDDPQAPSEARLQALMRAIVIHIQFLPALRHALGWRGLKQCVAAVEGWTARVQGCAGVFGLSFEGAAPGAAWLAGSFGLCYFPDPEEPLVENFSVRAAAYTQREDYAPRIREFLRHPELQDLFGIGRLHLALRPAPLALVLGLESLSTQRTIAADGLSVVMNGKSVELVPPGGRDQDLPAFAVALPFFEALAAAVGFNVEQPPDLLSERRFPATQHFYDAVGGRRTAPAADAWHKVLSLGYGEDDPTLFPDALWPEGKASLGDLKARDPDSVPDDYRERLWWRAHTIQASHCLDKKILGIDERPPLIILSGFLGAGKTSFLQHFIEYQTQRSRFVAVIQNEIGAIGLDGKLLDYTVTEIDEGCVCCGLVGNLKVAVAGILDSFSPDYIILETSGLANPLNLLEEMVELEERVRFDCTVTVVDALNFDAAQAHSVIAADQIRAADVLILNKCDLVNDAQRQMLRQRLAALKPNAPVFETTGGDLNPAFILDGDGASSHGGRAVIHGGPIHATHAHDGLHASSLTAVRRLDRSKLLNALAAIPPSIFRIKGIVDLSDPSQTMLLQYVAGRYELSDLPHPPTAQRFLTFIGQSEDSKCFPHVETLIRAAEA